MVSPWLPITAGSIGVLDRSDRRTASIRAVSSPTGFAPA